MTRKRVLFTARTVGHVMWWVFVVAALFAGGITWWMTEYVAVDASFVGGSHGWTVYTPTSGASHVVDLIGSSGPEWWQDPAVYALAAFVAVAIAAIVDALAARRLIAGIITVAAPFVALGLFVLATPGAIDEVYLHSTVSLVLILIGVAIREVLMRAIAPGVQDEPHG
ncbi:hypothetical protein [Gordonia sp. 'Campus']|uniref:hypothetical protein n=1 Tax=Gordonia sp. 'Campus' TaxID=2915824 RepID=UPI001EE4DB1D|nr:hypothetical protein [Gordonia sp. 'Campus']